MKRISTAVVAAAVATGLTLTPAGADTAALQPETGVTGTANGATEGKPAGEGTPANEDKNSDTKPDTTKPAQPAKKNGSSTGHLVGAATGIISAVLTTAIIVFSNPTGINKAVDLLNANFGLGLPHFALV